MKKLIILGFSLLMCLALHSQNHKWYYNYNNAQSEEGNDIAYGADGYIYVAGVAADDTDTDILVIKLNKSGVQEWVYSFEGQPGQMAEVSDIQVGSDGNIYVSGTTGNASGDRKFTVLSVDAQGNFRWAYVYDETGHYISEAYGLVYDENGRVYAAGMADYDFFVAGINASNGEQDWIYWFDGGCSYAMCDDEAWAITLGDDGNIYTAGYTTESSDKQLTLVSLSDDGHQNWKYMHPSYNVGPSWATGVVYGNDGRIYASCMINSDMGVICVDAAGHFQWNCNVDGPGPEPYFGENCYGLLYGIDDNVYVVGRAGGRDAITDTDMDAAVLKVNRQGQPEWFSRYEGLYGDYDMAFSITQTPDTNVHVAGYFCGLLAEAGTISIDHRTGRDIWVMRYVGPTIDMDVAYAITSDEEGYLYVTGYDYKASRLRDVYVWKLDPPRNTDGYYNLEGYATYGAGQAVLESADHSFAVAGWQGTSITASTYNMRLIKTDINGDTLWSHQYGGGNEDRAYGMAQCPDNGFILTGFTRSSGAGGKDLYLVKTDEAGNRQWEKTYGFESDEEGRSIATSTDGGYFIAGKTTRYDGSGDLWFMKTNAQGDSIWTKTYGGNRRDEVGRVHRTADGGYIFAGTKGHAQTIGYITNIYVIRFSAAGDTLWTREIGSEDYWENGGDILEQENGSFLLVGYMHNKDYIACLDPDGNTLWEKSSATEQNGGLNTIARNTDGNLLISKNEFGSKYMMNVRIYDPEGTMLRSDTIAYSPGNVYMPTTGRCFDACPTSYGGYIATGDGRIAGNASNWNIILYRKGGALTLLPLPPLGIESPKAQHNLLTCKPITITPNPVWKQVRMGFTLTHAAEVRMMVTDLTGQTVYAGQPVSMSAGDQELSFNASQFSNGVYTCRIMAGNEVFSGKFIILKHH